MICPWCNKEMTKGTIMQDRFAIKWLPVGVSREIFAFNPFAKGIKLTSFSENWEAIVYYCPDCRKFVIDQDHLHD